MSRATNPLFAAVLCALLIPAPAFAADSSPDSVDSLVHFGISLVGLLVAVLLLLEARRLGKVAKGSAVAEKLNYVVLATLCLAASAIAEWVQNFVPAVSIDQVRLASQVLVIVAMALLALYFANVRKALTQFMKAMTGSQLLAEESTSAQRDTTPGDDEGAGPRG